METRTYEEAVDAIAVLSGELAEHRGWSIAIAYSPEHDALAYEVHRRFGDTACWDESFETVFALYEPIDPDRLDEMICDALWWQDHDVAEHASRLAQLLY